MPAKLFVLFWTLYQTFLGCLNGFLFFSFFFYWYEITDCIGLEGILISDARHRNSKARVHLLWHVQRHTLLQLALCWERWRRGKNMCRKGGRAEKVLEANGFFFQLWGKMLWEWVIAHLMLQSSEGAFKVHIYEWGENEKQRGGWGVWLVFVTMATWHNRSSYKHISPYRPYMVACSCENGLQWSTDWLTFAPRWNPESDGPWPFSLLRMFPLRAVSSSQHHQNVPSPALTAVHHAVFIHEDHHQRVPAGEEMRSHLISCLTLTSAVCPVLAVNILFLVTLLCVFLQPSKAPCVRSSIKGNYITSITQLQLGEPHRDGKTEAVLWCMMTFEKKIRW